MQMISVIIYDRDKTKNWLLLNLFMFVKYIYFLNYIKVFQIINIMNWQYFSGELNKLTYQNFTENYKYTYSQKKNLRGLFLYREQKHHKIILKYCVNISKWWEPF